jgi:acetoin utilization deacetylase AcuC-like enzyme
VKGVAPFRIYFPDTPPLPLPEGHRFPAHKYALLRQTVIADAIVSPGQLIAAPIASIDDLCRAHDADYVGQVIAGTLPAAQQKRIGLPWSATLAERARATVGGTLAAAREALVHGVSGQLAGGTHHAHREGGAGFCVFNDCAVAALTLLADGVVARVGVLDLDVHQGDGNATILGPDPRVYVASVHGANNYPTDKPPSDLDIGLPDGTGDADYLSASNTALQAVVSFKPDVVFYIAGVDPLASDRLGRLAVTADGLAARDRLVLTACRDSATPVVVLAGGGYSDPISATVAAYAATFRIARSVFG